ncbi:DUF3365 domain-containing protein [Aureitalea sp. L0-47]|uniref:Tll0287-like domain-containing protein n=1 Tax=Aureitalea sp. L0-47 TaxID=2816962 RepID=UPI002238075B|nr:DUF3365 domain-containing protein [Aureitalea sp. L0-47]MCW5518835.1 DUF3365 domain-containing protein [Aureitalea sp. L0-47]
MKTILLVISLLLLLSCNSGPDKSYQALLSDPTVHSDDPEHPGKALMEQYCYACHSATAPHDERLGPPMIAIKKHYISEGTTKEEFTNDMLNWVKDPAEEKSKMPGAVRRFGVMPKQVFPEDVIQKISEYMYDYEIEQPEWFEEHFQEMQGKGMGKGNGRGQGMGMGRGKGQGNGQGNGRGKGQGKGMNGKMQGASSNSNPEVTGMRYARTTKAELGRNLMQTINRKGTVAAIEFCNEKAYPITDSMATVHNAMIKRVSDKPRNPDNKATAAEIFYIEDYKSQLAKGEDPEPMILKKGDETTFYYPIVTNTLCMQCHGDTSGDLKPGTLAKLKELYPMDKATGYSVNEVRGMWRIQFGEKTD